MKRTTVLLLISLAISVSPVIGFYGGSMTFTPGNRYPDGTVEMHFYYRESGRGPCDPHISWFCESGDCGYITYTEPMVTDQDHSNQNQWCQTERHLSINITRNDPFILKSCEMVVPRNLTESTAATVPIRMCLSCCWPNNVNDVRELTLHTHVDTRRRSDTQSLNRSPVSAVIPDIRVPQNCFQSLQLLAYDPDGDDVRCNCSSCHQHQNINLDEDSCTLNRNGLLDMGLHVFEIILEDYPISNITLTNGNGMSFIRNAFNETANSNPTPLSQVPLQFVIEILPPVQSCLPGQDRPSFLTPTPLQGDIQYAAVGYVHIINLCAQNSGNSIVDFQISGPSNMSKTLKNESHSIAVATLTWTPQEMDLHRHVPVCFSAETLHSQSEMRCIVVFVAKSKVLSGDAEVICEDHRISIVISKSSMKEIDQNWLQLSDPTCSLTSNETHILGTVSLNTCGTTMEDSGDFLVFKNEINSFENPNAVITRRNQVKIGFSCQYPKVASVSSHYVNHKSDYIFTESSFGTFGYTFEIFTDKNFSSQVDPSLYPVEINLMDMLYMGIEARSTLPEVRLFVESCRATPEDNLYTALYYDIIKDGCILDNTVEVFQNDSTKFDFGIQAFKFTGDYNQVYISCTVILCADGSLNSRCAQGCLRESPRKRRRDLNQETARHYISQGPFRVLRQTQTLASASENGGSLHISASTGVFAGLFIVSLVLVGLFAYNAKKKAKALDHQHLLSSF